MSLNYFNNLNFGVQVIDPEMRYVFLNNALLKTLDKSIDEHIGKKMEEVYQGIEDTDIYKKIQQTLEDGKSRSYINEFVFEDGRHTIWELTLDRISEGVIIFSKDITDSEEGVRLIIESNTKLIEKGKELQRINTKLKKVMGHIAHDMRAPLGNIYSLAELIEHYPDESSKYISKIKEVVNSSMELIYNMLDASAIESGKVKLTIEKTSLSKIILERIDFFKIQQPLLKFDVSCSDQLFEIDPMRMEQVINNLLSNAIKYSLANSLIRISLSDEGEFTIENQIDHDKVKKSLEKVDLTESVGLGLEIVKSILMLHSTHLVVEKNDETYTCSFTI